VPTCDYCGVSIQNPFECNHCKASHCGEHRLPEKHGCPFAGVLETPDDRGTEKYGYRVHGDSGVEEPEPLDLSDRAHISSDTGESPKDTDDSNNVPTQDSSPDVAPDGSIGDETPGVDHSEPSPQTGDTADTADAARTGYNKTRAWVKAPFGLLRRYFIPILAFLVVFGLVLFFLS